MDPVDHRHQRPEGEVLHLRGHDALDHAAAAETLKDGPEERAVGQVDAQGSERPAASKTPQQAQIGVRRTEASAESGLGRGPRGRGDGAR
jgi:hypothetical protein